MKLIKQQEVNDLNEVIDVINTMNIVIDGLYNLSAGALSGDPFNTSTTVDDALKTLFGYCTGNTGVDIFFDFANKMELFRSIIVGSRLEWKTIANAEVPK